MANSNRAAAAKRAAEMREQEARKDRQRKQLIAAVVAAIVVLMAVAIGIVIAKQPKETGNTDAGAAAIAQLKEIPASAFDAAGAPTSANSIPAKVEGGEIRKDGDKPEVLYVGAEFCPYCATERWALVAALDRFGDFTGLTPTRSADNEGNIPTVSFVDSKYTSDYVSFKAWETQDRTGQPMQELPADIKTLMAKTNPQGSIPWTFFGTNETIGSGVAIDPFLSLTGPDGWTKIVDQMKTGTGDVGTTTMSTANAITAQICSLTENKPADVCTSEAVVRTAPMLKK